MNIKIREIAESDFEALLALFLEFAVFEKLPEKMTNTLEEMRAEKAYLKGFVAVNTDNEIVGYVTCFFAYYTWIGKSLYMDDLYVRPSYRGCGVGTKLINSVIAFAKAEQCKKLKWQVSEWNQPAIDFYKSLGASVDGVESNCDLLLETNFQHQ
ncbi:MAG: GNAT family N-acetyltransferase [Bacteroidetes bacterium]|nr:GNAT family N-acetyltransferase [Bacteroidota bacterium]